MVKFLSVSTDNTFHVKIRDLAKVLKIPLTTINDLDSSVEESNDFNFAMVDCRKIESDKLAEICQLSRQLTPNAKIVVIISNRIRADHLPFIYKSGASLLITEEEFLFQSKLNLYLSYYATYNFIPVKASDFKPLTDFDFIAYHFISYKNKMIPAISSNLSVEKHQKMMEINEFYIKREDISKYQSYLKKQNYNGPEGILRRCRAKYLEFFENYIQLVFQLTDNSKSYTYEEGRKILADTLKLSEELLLTLSTSGDPWLVVNNLNQELDNPLTRIPSIASFVGISSLLGGIGNPQELMLATLISDLGLLKLSPNTLKRDPSTFSTEELTWYHQHPLASLNLVAERKLPVNDDLKKVILHTHERSNGTGFPKGKTVLPERIPLESQLIQACEILDSRTTIKPHLDRPIISDEKKRLIEELAETGMLSPALVKALRLAWI